MPGRVKKLRYSSGLTGCSRSTSEGGTMKRSRQEIFSQILNICMNGANKTRIVYQANLNFRTVNPYLDILIKNQHLMEVGQGEQVLYQTTQKGINLLESINKVNNTLFHK